MHVGTGFAFGRHAVDEHEAVADLRVHVVRGQQEAGRDAQAREPDAEGHRIHVIDVDAHQPRALLFLRDRADGPAELRALDDPQQQRAGRERTGRMSISQQTMRHLLDSIATRLDEARDISRYMTGLLVFLGLLGTFWGLIETVGSVSHIIDGLKVGGEAGALFDTLKEGLAAPRSGMGISFSSSLFGLAGSLILGFLDLQAGQAQNRFYNELEEWLSTVTDISNDFERAPGMLGDTVKRLERIEQALTNNGGANANAPMMALAGQITALTEQLRHEQQLIRRLAENQEALGPVLERLASRIDR